MREWLWLGMAADLVMLAFSLHMAVDAVAVFNSADVSDVATGAVGLFVVLPVFCVVAPVAAWRAFACMGSRSPNRKRAHPSTLRRR